MKASKARRPAKVGEERVWADGRTHRKTAAGKWETVGKQPVRPPAPTVGKGISVGFDKSFPAHLRPVVEEAVGALPRRVREALGGVRFVGAPLAEKSKTLLGYYVPGSLPFIKVFSHYKVRGKVHEVTATEIRTTVAHEAGHAFDYHLGKGKPASTTSSKMSGLRHAWWVGNKRLTNLPDTDYRRRIAEYFTSDSKLGTPHGQQEVFAEMVAHASGLSGGPRMDVLVVHFPEARAIAGRLAERG